MIRARQHGGVGENVLVNNTKDEFKCVKVAITAPHSEPREFFIATKESAGYAFLNTTVIGPMENGSLANSLISRSALDRKLSLRPSTV
ncbi:MAG: hypothetical protein LBT64_03035, partial [Puniceicoccales bacterium]|nr:hypothetical protein [Puniceicoccales bacterium]